MRQASDHPFERQRVNTLLCYEVLDTADEQAFDELTELASTICGTPISLISLVDDHRQWFKSKVGLQAQETDKSIAFCSHAILQDNVFEVPNALEDQRFHDNPLVTGAPDIRFYAGAPLVAPDGSPIGTLCVIDQVPRQLEPHQLRALQILAKQVIGQLDLRIHHRRLERLNQQREQLFAMLAHDLRSPFNVIMGFSRMLSDKAEKLSPSRIQDVSHRLLSSSIQFYQLLDELLQWSQQTLGSLQCKIESQKLWHLVESNIDLLCDAAELKSLELVNDIPAHIKVDCDTMITKSVIRNLLSNAIKYSPHNQKVVIACKIETKEVKVSVSDFGGGIPEKNKSGLFAESLNSTFGTDNEQGFGIGLHLCHQFLKMQNNSIWLDEHYTEGARFVFNLWRTQESAEYTSK